MVPYHSHQLRSDNVFRSGPVVVKVSLPGRLSENYQLFSDGIVKGLHVRIVGPLSIEETILEGK